MTGVPESRFPLGNNCSEAIFFLIVASTLFNRVLRVEKTFSFL